MIIVEGLMELLLCVHDEGTVLGNRLIQRLSSYQHEPSSLGRLKLMHELLLFLRFMQDTAMQRVNQIIALVYDLPLINKHYSIPDS